jgi:catechol 2,3-dioxygenase-like lactoylglutathione lyase family enzyme
MKNARLLHYSHCVSDLARSRAFYVDVLGFEPVLEVAFDDPATAQVMALPGCKFAGLFLKRDGMRIELIAFSDPPPDGAVRKRRADEIGHSHLSFYVLSLDETLADLRAQGVPVEDATRTVLPSGIECCVVRDPDGFPIEIVQVPTLDLLPYDVPYVPQAEG